MKWRGTGTPVPRLLVQETVQIKLYFWHVERANAILTAKELDPNAFELFSERKIS